MMSLVLSILQVVLWAFAVAVAWRVLGPDEQEIEWETEREWVPASERVPPGATRRLRRCPSVSELHAGALIALISEPRCRRPR
jgi:hypothetical protein